DQLEVAPLLLRSAARQPNALARDHIAPEKFEELREMWIAGRIRDAAMKIEVFVDRSFTTRDCAVDRGQGALERRDLLRACPLGGERRSFHLDRQAQLHDLEDIGDGARTVGIDPEGHTAGIGRNEGAGALPRYHQPL